LRFMVWREGSGTVRRILKRSGPLPTVPSNGGSVPTLAFRCHLKPLQGEFLKRVSRIVSCRCLLHLSLSGKDSWAIGLVAQRRKRPWIATVFSKRRSIHTNRSGPSRLVWNG